jgi:uncharacterized phage protein (TIGR02218 family)
MAFNDIEISEYFQPVELYRFTRGPNVWLFTSGDTDIVLGADTYVAVAIKRGKIEATQDLGKTSLKITMSRRVSFLTQFIATSPTDIIAVTVTRMHDTDTAELAVTYSGRVVNVKLTENEGEIVCQPLQTALRRPGLRRVYQSSCPHVLYGNECNLSADVFKVTGVLTDVSGLTITSTAFSVAINPAFNATYFVGGYVEFVVAGATNRRFITGHDNGSGILTLNLSFVGISVGDTVSVFAGCDHTTTTCNGKFNNIANHGGFPFIPIKNPMDGTPVF